VAQLAMYRVGFVQWKFTRLLPDLAQKSRIFDFDEPDEILIEVSVECYRLSSPMLGIK
jgi:hypothetical protein